MEWQTALAYTLVVLLSLAGIYYLYWRYAASPPYVLLPTITSKLCKHNGNKEPHYLAYITAEEHKMLVKKEGLGLRRPGTQGVPCYPKRKRSYAAITRHTPNVLSTLALAVFRLFHTDAEANDPALPANYQQNVRAVFINNGYEWLHKVLLHGNACYREAWNVENYQNEYEDVYEAARVEAKSHFVMVKHPANNQLAQAVYDLLHAGIDEQNDGIQARDAAEVEYMHAFAHTLRNRGRPFMRRMLMAYFAKPTDQLNIARTNKYFGVTNVDELARAAFNLVHTPEERDDTVLEAYRQRTMADYRRNRPFLKQILLSNAAYRHEHGLVSLYGVQYRHVFLQERQRATQAIEAIRNTRPFDPEGDGGTPPPAEGR